MAAWLPWTFAAFGLAAALSWLYSAQQSGSPLLDPAPEIQRIFTATASDMAAEGNALLSDTSLVRMLMFGNAAEVADGFEALARRHDDPFSGVELLDARGNILAWSGRTWNAGPETTAIVGIPTQTARVERVGALVVLRVVVHDPAAGRSARLHRPLSVETPALERLFGRPPFVMRAEDIASRSVHVYPVGVPGIAGERIPLIAFGRDTVAEARLGRPGRSSRAIDDATALLAVLALLCALAWAWRWAATVRRAWSAAVPATLVWCTRILMNTLEVPTRWSLGDIVDPRSYAAPSLGDLSSSPADLLLSALALFVSVWWIDRGLGRWEAGESSGRERWRWYLAAFAWLVASALLTRGYVMAVRSLVADSTATIYDASSVWPTPVAAVLIAALFFLTLTFRTIWVWTVRSWTAASISLGVRKWPLALVSSALGAGLMIAVVLQISSFSVVPWWLIALAWMAAAIIIAVEEGRRLPRAVRWLPHGAAILLAAIPLLDHEVSGRQYRSAERILREQIQPGDAWFAFLLGTDLRALSEDRDAASMLMEPRQPSSGRSAFRLWSRTVLSQQRLNSGVALYDADGVERDRFMSGIGTYEQQYVLRTVFDADEESVQTIDLSSGGVRRVFYGGWTTVRSDDNNVHGSVALVVAPSSEESIILSTATGTTGSAGVPSFVEYRRGRAVWSGVRNVAVGAELPGLVVRELDEHPGKAILRTEGGRGLVYVRDPNEPERILAAVVPEMDIRWWLFHAVKISLLFGLLGLAGALVRPTWRSAARAWLASFQGRLFVAFASIALVPLMILAWSNRTISRERTERNQEETLRRDLALVQQRLSASILGEEDLERGLDDDFCRSVASDLGVEFSVFRTERLRASSRPELYTSGVLDARLPAEAFAQVQLRSAGFHVTTERIGAMMYAVGYGTFDVEGRPAGIVAIPTLSRQAVIDEDLAERNAFLLVTAAGVFLLVLAAGGWLAERIAGPVRRLTLATEQLRDGRTPGSLRTDRRDEIGSLMNAFDRMASELDESRRRIAQAEREQAWREMAKQVAHEIKNPLTPIKLSLQHLRQAFKDQAKDREALVVRVADTVLEQVEALARIATEFSRFARLPERQFVRVDVIGSIREAAALFGSVQGVSFSLDLPDEPAIVVADADELRRVFINLFRNSVQAMEGRGSVHIKAIRTGRSIQITVRDSGPGVASEARSRIFEPSFSTKTEGMGLGLAIVRSVIIDLGGSIELLSDGPGATFRIIIPLH
jgi:signal transduction histidine kinase